MLGYLSADIICSEKRTVFRFASRNFNNFQIFWKFSLEISVPWFRKFGSNGKRPRTTLWGDLNFRKFLTGIKYKVKFPPQWNFGLNGSLRGFRFSSGVFGKRSQEISLPFVPISKFSEFEVGWKTLQILKCARSKNRMEIIGTPRESDKVSVFWEKQEENERQTFVLKIL